MRRAVVAHAERVRSRARESPTMNSRVVTSERTRICSPMPRRAPAGSRAPPESARAG